MDQESVNRMITSVRWTNALLQMLDAEKKNSSITLGEIHNRFKDQYLVDPASDEFWFYNQHQFLTSLWAYLCMPSEKFYDDLPDRDVSSLAPGWGLEVSLFRGTLRRLVRTLRNAVSHGHVTVTPDLLFEFRDSNATVVFNHVNLHKFCQAIAYWCLTKDADLRTLK